MQHIHDTLHNMPGIVVGVIFVLLLVASVEERVTNDADTIGSWFAFATIIFGAVAWWWV